MAIFGIVGGIGSGKTLAMVYLLAQDSLKRNKKIMSNIIIDIPRFQKVSSELLEQLGESMKNTSVGIDEIHNMMDSRSSANKKVKKKSHFILQSRHAGEGSLDIYYTTQHSGQVDLRLRNNTDVWIYPTIIKRDENNKPLYMILTYTFQYGQKKEDIDEIIYIEPFTDIYDTHEIVMLEED